MHSECIVTSLSRGRMRRISARSLTIKSDSGLNAAGSKRAVAATAERSEKEPGYTAVFTVYSCSTQWQWRGYARKRAAVYVSRATSASVGQ